MTLHLALLVALMVGPTFGRHLSLGMVLLIAGWLFCLRLSCISSADLERLFGTSMLDALHYARIPVKEACAIMQIDYTHFMLACKGQGGRHIAVAPLLRLPYRCWGFLLPELAFLAAKHGVNEIAEGLADVLRVS
jgi:hypothetical protein